MFGLFKSRKKSRPIEQWEINLLVNTIRLLPIEYMLLEVQATEGLFVKALTGYGDNDPNYVAFSFDPDLIDEVEKERDYKLTGIKVYDTVSKSWLNYIIYVSAAVISGYTITGAEKFMIDPSQIDVNKFVKAYYKTPDFEKLKAVLTDEELALLNPDNVYIVDLNSKAYYHIFDLEDGDFIGMDTDKVIYKITHDPFAITPTGQSLQEAILSH